MTQSNRRAKGNKSTRANSSRGGSPRTAPVRQASGSKKQAPAKRSAKRRNSANPLTVVLTILIVLLVMGTIAGTLIYTNVKYLYNEDVIIPGVVVGGVDLSKMTREDAYLALSTRLDEEIQRLKINITYQGQSWAYDHEDLGASGDVSSILDEVVKYGHEGTLEQRLAAADYILANEENFDITFGYNEDVITTFVRELKTNIDTVAIDPFMEFDASTKVVYGVEYPYTLLYRPVEKLRGMEGFSIPTFDDMFVLSKGRSGFEVDLITSVNAIMNDLADDYVANIELVMIPVEPKLTETDLLESTELVYHSRSKLVSSSDTARDKNVAKALSSFDGIVLQPGEQLSFNETTGERTASNGYQLANGISQSKRLELVYGGGVCQAATVMSNAAMMAGAEVARNSHSWTAYKESYNYDDIGRDAMVNWGTSDLVITNVTDYPIYFNTYVYWYTEDNATWAYCDVHTKPLPDNQHYEILSVTETETPAPESKYEELSDYTLYLDQTWNYNADIDKMVFEYVKPRTGYIVRIYRLTKDANGVEINREELYPAEYDPIQGVYYTKPALEQQQDEPPAAD